MGWNVIQANEIKTLGLEKGQSGGHVPLAIAETPILTISEKLIKSLGKFFDSSIRDTASMKSAGEKRRQNRPPGKFKALVYQHGILPEIQ